MLKDITKLQRELDRLQGRRVWIEPGPGQPPVEVGAGTRLEMLYKGGWRHIRIVRVLAWGLRAHDLDRRAIRTFRFDRIGTGPVERPPTE